MPRNHFTLAAVPVLLAAIAPVASAQLLEDVDLRREGDDAVANIRFVTPVQYQRHVASRSSDLVQVFYTVLPTADRLKPAASERRIAGKGELPQLIVTDETTAAQAGSSRQLLIRFSIPTRFSVRPGRDKQSIQLVLPGLGAAVEAKAAPAAAAAAGAGRYVVRLQRAERPGEPLKASVPSEFQDNVVFTSRSVIDGKSLYDTSVGYFRTLPEAEAALAILSKRFPSASIVNLQPAPAAAPAMPAPAAPAAPAPVLPVVPVVPVVPTPTPAPAPAEAPQPAAKEPVAPPADVGARAAGQLADAQAAYARGDFGAAITALNALLALPPNASSRQGQELIGQARAAAGDNGRARAEFELFLKLYPQGPDSDRVRRQLASLSKSETTAARGRGPIEPTTTTTGSVSLFYFGGNSQVRTQEFQDSPIGGLPTLLSESTLSSTDLKQVHTSIDLNWRYRDTDTDRRFVFREAYTADLMPGRSNRNRLSALYYEDRSSLHGTSVRVGRQSPTGGGVLYRFDGIQAGYTFAPKWKINGVWGVPSDKLLDTHRNFYGLSLDAEALNSAFSSSLYVIQQMVDHEVDRRAVGTELRYFKGGFSVNSQLDYDLAMGGMNIVSVQGAWQLPDTTVYNFLYDKRATPLRALSNTLFFQDPTQLVLARTMNELLATTTLDVLKERANAVTPFQTQAMIGFTTPVAANWQAGADLRYTIVDAIPPVPVILPTGQPSTGDLWSLGLQAIGSNLFSVRDTHVFNVTYLTGPTYKGTLVAYNNLTSLNAQWQLEPSLRFYTQNDDMSNKVNRWTTGLRLTYRIRKQLSLESQVDYEASKTTSPLRNENSHRTFYYVGGRYDF